MNIKTVKELELFYIINDSLLAPKDNSNRFYRKVQSWIDNGGTIEPEFTNKELLQIAIDKKKKEIKALRESNRHASTPQTITYEGNLENKTFDISIDKDLAMFGNIISDLQEDIDNGAINPTRNWSDATGERLALKIGDFKSLKKHLNSRDEQEYDQARLKIDAIEDLNTIEEVEAFDINQIIV